MNIRYATEADRPAVFALRFEVFVDEQQVPPDIEIDEEDDHALHIIAEADGTPVGCARLLLEDGEGHIGRLAVKKIYRGQGIGAAICRFVIDDCRRRGCTRVWLNAQLRATGFYEKLGFSPVGETFWEAGIEHVTMDMRIPGL